MVSACVVVSYGSVSGTYVQRQTNGYLGHVPTDRVDFTIFGVCTVLDRLKLLLGGLVRSLKLKIV